MNGIIDHFCSGSFLRVGHLPFLVCVESAQLSLGFMHLQNLSYFGSSYYSHAVFDDSCNKIGAALKSLGEKSCEIKGGGQQMAAMMLMLVNSMMAVHFKNLLVLTALQPFVGRHL